MAIIRAPYRDVLVRTFGDSTQGRRDYARLIEHRIRDHGEASPFRPMTREGLCVGGLPALARNLAAPIEPAKLFIVREHEPEHDEDIIGHFAGYASIFGSQNDWDEIFEPGAWEKTLAEERDRMRSLWQHRRWFPLGIPDEDTVEDDIGLWWSSPVMALEWAADPMKAMRFMLVTGLSVGFRIRKFWIDFEGNAASRGWPIFHIIEAQLLEVSPVTWGSDPLAQIVDVRAMLERAKASHSLANATYNNTRAPHALPAATDEPTPEATPEGLPSLSNAVESADALLELLSPAHQKRYGDSLPKPSTLPTPTRSAADDLLAAIKSLQQRDSAQESEDDYADG